ncbi:TMEM165/GDT1 family protein [Synechococcus sp. CS-1329]|uniref:TMEM165/GDT1 family protein n=1 Tax=Synechococcus sp. CS-1329 TaxID=2847975 RepID=UPI00223ABB1C|nr:TMEM165/GDT1 family protein [Synechococcus sp. CS-1329]MCT0217857.1 TMEM165/GDT1 family protein [Synechococcus sp. CS-1329]
MSEPVDSDLSASPEACADPDASTGSADPSDFVSVAATTFTTVFLAELGDKTQLAALLLSAESGRPGVVFAGAALALICSSLVGVLLGRWLAAVLPAQRLERISGVLMVSLGLFLGGQASLGLLRPVIDLPNP